MENPQLLSAQREPLPMHNERFVLKRTGIKFNATAKQDGIKFRAHNADLYLSNLRLFLVAHGNANIDSFDLPLATMKDVQFNQPIFAANNLTGCCPPLEQSSCAHDIHFTLAFHTGGVGTFLPIFFTLLKDIQARVQAQTNQDSDVHIPVAVPVATAENIVQTAFVDPNDPTQIYVAQATPVAGMPVAVAEPLR